MIRRFVVGEVDGGSDIIIDDDATPTLELAPHVFARDIWLNRSTPADLTVVSDPVRSDRMTHEPPSGGAIFRIVHFLPGSGQLTAEQALEMHAKLESVHVPASGDLAAAKDASMHRTNSLNYMTLVSGRLWMLTEGRDVLLSPGDMVVQNGGIHGWRHEGEEPALLLAVLIDGVSN